MALQEMFGDSEEEGDNGAIDERRGVTWREIRLEVLREQRLERGECECERGRMNVIVFMVGFLFFLVAVVLSYFTYMF